MEHLNDNHGQEASDYLDRLQEFRAKLRAAIGGFLRAVDYNGPHDMNPVRRKRRKYGK